MKIISIPILIFFLAGLIIACNTEKKTDQPETQAETKLTTECFQYIQNNDTVSLTLNITGNKVTGQLTYGLYEKDKNNGTIQGEIKGDTILADYTFSSEGVTSIREVVFLNKDAQLIQGFGETTHLEGKEKFKNRQTLSFDNALVLSLAECEKN